MPVIISRFASRLSPVVRLRLGRQITLSSPKLLSTQTDPPFTRKDQLKRAISQYGPTVIVFHVTISLASLGFFYLLVSSGIDVVSLVGHLPYVGEKLENSSIAAGASTFVIAYAVHKVFAPVRISITLGSVPFIVRFLRAKGILKKPPGAG